MNALPELGNEDCVETVTEHEVQPSPLLASRCIPSSLYSVLTSVVGAFFNWFGVLYGACEAHAHGERKDCEKAIGHLFWCGGLEY